MAPCLDSRRLCLWPLMPLARPSLSIELGMVFGFSQFFMFIYLDILNNWIWSPLVRLGFAWIIPIQIVNLGHLQTSRKRRDLLQIWKNKKWFRKGRNVGDMGENEGPGSRHNNHGRQSDNL